MNKNVKRTIAVMSAIVISMSMAIPTSAIGNNVVTKKVYINSSCPIFKNTNIKDILKKFGFSFKEDDTDDTSNTAENVQETPATKPNINTQDTVTNSDTSTNVNTNNTSTEQNESEYVVSDYEKEVVRLVNEIRVQNGLSELTINTKLSKVARIKAQDMCDNRYFSHTSPTYGSPFDMMKSFGITYRSAGENIASGQRTSQEVVTAWMNSDGHRKNILNSSFKKIGMGYVANGNYWCQMFIG